MCLAFCGLCNLQFEGIDRVNGELRDHARNSAGHELGPGVDSCWIVVTFQFGKCPFSSLLTLGNAPQNRFNAHLIGTKLDS